MTVFDFYLTLSQGTECMNMFLCTSLYKELTWQKAVVSKYILRRTKILGALLKQLLTVYFKKM